MLPVRLDQANHSLITGFCQERFHLGFFLRGKAQQWSPHTAAEVAVEVAGVLYAGNAHVGKMIDFIRAGKRPLTMGRRGKAEAGEEDA